MLATTIRNNVHRQKLHLHTAGIRMPCWSINSKQRISYKINQYTDETYINIETLPQVIILSGATGVGKSDVALKLCQTITNNINNYNLHVLNRKLNKHLDNRKCEIIIADSVQIYKHLNIGSTKPTTYEMKCVKHHLVGNIDLSTSENGLTAGSYVDRAMDAIHEVCSTGNIAIVVGGATMWMNWLLHGKPKLSKCVSKDIRIRAQGALSTYDQKNRLRINKDGNTDDLIPASLSPSKSMVTLESNRACDVETAWDNAVDYVSNYILEQIARGGSGVTNAYRIPENQALLNEKQKTDLNRLLPLLRKIPINNYKQLARYLEIAMTIVESSNKSDNEEFHDEGVDYSKGLLHLYPPRADGSGRVKCFFLTSSRRSLYKRIDERCIRMLENGLLGEVTSLLMNNHLVDISDLGCLSNNSTIDDHHVYTASSAVIASQSIGYKQSIEFLMKAAKTRSHEENISKPFVEDILDQFQFYISDFAATSRNYARYQMAWFRKDPCFVWCAHDADGSKSSNLKMSKLNDNMYNVVNEIIFWCVHTPATKEGVFNHSLSRADVLGNHQLAMGEVLGAFAASQPRTLNAKQKKKLRDNCLDHSMQIAANDIDGHVNDVTASESPLISHEILENYLQSSNPGDEPTSIKSICSYLFPSNMPVSEYKGAYMALSEELSALDPSIRLKETAKNSSVRTYQCEFDNIMQYLKPKSSTTSELDSLWNAIQSIADPDAVSVADTDSTTTTTKSKHKKVKSVKIPIDAQRLLYRLKPILIEFYHCRKKLQQHYRLMHE